MAEPNLIACAEGFSLSVLSAHGPLDLDALNGCNGFMMVSIKNRQFTDQLIGAYCNFATQYLRNAYLTVVDQPYVSNVRATARNANELAVREAGVWRLSVERRKQVERIIRKHPTSRISFVSWEELAERTPVWIVREIREAFARRDSFHKAVLDQTRPRLTGVDDLTTLEAHAEFLLSEVPILLYCYYLFDNRVADFYPGPQAEFLWRIERGEFASELPEITALSRRHAGQVYVEIHPIVEGPAKS